MGGCIKVIENEGQISCREWFQFSDMSRDGISTISVQTDIKG
jgi:hypothetical protein